MNRSHGLATLLLGLLLVPAGLAGQATTPVLRFGGPEANPAIELLEVSGVLRRPDGRMVVVNGKPLEVRLHDARGGYVRTLGSAGGGPGQYSGGVLLEPWPGDSIAVFSTGSRRWMLYRPDGRLVREWPHGDPPIGGSWVTLRGSTLVRTGVTGSAGCAVELAQAHPALMRPGEAFTDAAGRLWRHDVGDLRWEVRDPDGRVVGRVRLPPEFWPTQFVADTMVGVHRDADGFPIVMVLATGFGMPPGPLPIGCAPRSAPDSKVSGSAMRSALRNAMTFGEAHKARHGRYPASVAALPERMAPPGAALRILRASGDSWVIAIVDPESTSYCLISLGPEGVPGMPSGVLHCGW